MHLHLSIKLWGNIEDYKYKYLGIYYVEKFGELFGFRLPTNCVTVYPENV